jgi:hypothetical protein
MKGYLEMTTNNESKKGEALLPTVTGGGTQSQGLPDIRREEFEMLQRQCKAFIASGFLPEHIKTVAQAVTIATKGRELGLPILQSFSSISVIKGKPTLSSELMLALIYQKVKGAKITFKTPPDKQNVECECTMQRPGGEPMSFKFTIDDAKRAGISNGGAWAKYPAAMLRARCISAGARAVFPDAIMGCYTPEELGGEVEAEELDVTPTIDVKPTMADEYFAKKEVTPLEQVIAQDVFPMYEQDERSAIEEDSRPKQADYPRANPGWETEPMTDKQRGRYFKLCDLVGVEAKEYAFKVLGDVICKDGTPSLHMITKSQIQTLFKKLEADLGQRA